MNQLSKRKFLRYGVAYQHYLSAKHLRTLYERLLQKKSINLSEYTTIQCWMGLPSLESPDPKQLADRYHFHLQKAGKNLKEHNLLPSIRQGDHPPKAPFASIAIYLDQIRSAYNVGSILRTTEALRIGSIHGSGITPLLNNEKVQRTALGSAELVPCYQDTPLSELPRPFIALETSDEALPLAEFLFPPSFTLILGNEEYGVSDSLLKETDYLLEIPLFGAKNSLNVACAYAIAAAQIRHQILG